MPLLRRVDLKTFKSLELQLEFAERASQKAKRLAQQHNWSQHPEAALEQGVDEPSSG